MQSSMIVNYFGHMLTSSSSCSKCGKNLT